MIVPPGHWQLQIEGDKIVCYRVGVVGLQHELDKDSAPHLVDYMGGKVCHVWGFVEDGLLVIERKL